MKAKTLFLIAFLLFCGFAPAEAKRAATLDIGKGSATVSFLKGSAEILELGKGPWTSLKLSDALEEGDQVRTKEGAQMELVLTDNSRLRFAGNSEFKVVRMEAGGPSAPRDVNVHVALGKAWANVAKTIGAKGNFAIACDQAVAGVRGTVYRMNIDADRSALVRVYDGKVHVTGGGKAMEAPKPIGPPTRISGPTPIPGPHKVSMEEWTVIIKAMQQVRIGADGVPEKPRDFTEKEDRNEWVEWNKARDREI
ncbi:MAG: FecR family protein [Proteobacteria bacterium]|nr:FecR family protein [Pseudomonadota bacterium]MBU1744428.1 FecR family protein [Pseudomonadota bacterium]MBU1965360.1 FecR family protein [Pseudomonadota bacterium]